jgi:NADP-dependent 3-hydroxy acid dehydrogenase YdfG
MADPARRPTAVITGASSGIGAAAAQRLAALGWGLVIGARRAARLAEVAAATNADARPLDVTDPASIEAFCDGIEHCDLLVNNAGGALGLAPVLDADEEQWRWMYDANVLGPVRLTKALAPRLEADGGGHVVMVGSIAAFQAYPGGAGYNAAKFGIRAVTTVLRQELLGRPIRVTEVDPGMVDTEFSVVRFGGDRVRADKVYAGMTPLTADDVADAIVWAATRPAHVNIDQIVLTPLDQASATQVYRRT